MGFFALVPSAHRYYLPENSPGWSFGWIGIYHPYLFARIAKQVTTTGPVVHASASSPLHRRAVRLVRGAFAKYFRDRLEVETELFAFSHAFRARTGLTPAHFITEVRVEQAARLLATTTLTVTQVAARLGFANGNHFGKVFRRHRHQSPEAYRSVVR